MEKDGKKYINFKFAKNWKAFLDWHKTFSVKAKCMPPWEFQSFMIQKLFESSNPNIVNWNKLWFDFIEWRKTVFEKKDTINWSEQQRQIETLMLEQLKELNREQFFLAFLDRGRPAIDSQVMTYWEALRVKQQLGGDKNGRGGDENIDRISIININNLIQ